MKGIPETLQVMLSVSKAIVSNLEIEKVGQTIVEQASEVVGSDHGALFLMEPANQHLYLMAAKGFDRDEYINLELLASWEKIEEQVLQARRSLLVNNLDREFIKGRLSIKSFLAVPLEQNTRLLGILIVTNKGIGKFTYWDSQILLALANHASIAMVNAELYRENEELFFSIMKSLAEAIDAKDPYTHGHAERVTLYSEGLAKQLGLPLSEIKSIKIAALLHDVGKIGIPDRILCKDAPLTEEEYRVMQQHPLIGARIIQGINHSDLIIPGIRDHHERYDGKGYPKGLKAEQISLAGRIVSITDAFDAMTTDRPYRKRLPTEEAMMELVRCGGTQFDPELVAEFQRYITKTREKLFHSTNAAATALPKTAA